MNPTLWLGLCRREMIELTRVFSSVTWILRCLLSVGVFLPLIAPYLPWLGAGFLFESFQMLILCAGSAQLTVWAHESTARDCLNRETLAVAGVSQFQSLAAKAIVGALVAVLLGTSALVCFYFLAPFAQLSSGDMFRSALFLTVGLILSVNCSLWAASRNRSQSQAMSAILFSLIAVWLGLPLAGWIGRELVGFSFLAEMLNPVATFTSHIAGVPSIVTGLAWLLFLCVGFFLTAIPRLERIENTIARPSRFPKLERFVLGNLLDSAESVEHPYLPRFALCLPDAVSYLKQAMWFFVVAIVCFLLQYSNPVWLWIALSTVVVGQMFHGSWIWHSSVPVTDEDRRIGDAATCLDQSGRSRRALQRWFVHISRLSRWMFLPFYVVLALTAWLADANFPWVLFAVLAAALWVMPPGLTGITHDLAGKASLALQHFMGVVALMVCPLFLGVMLSHFAGPKGFLIGTALGALILAAGLVTVDMVARSPLFLMARLGVLQCRYRLLPAFVLHFGRRW